MIFKKQISASLPKCMSKRDLCVQIRPVNGPYHILFNVMIEGHKSSFFWKLRLVVE